MNHDGLQSMDVFNRVHSYLNSNFLFSLYFWTMEDKRRGRVAVAPNNLSEKLESVFFG